MNERERIIRSWFDMWLVQRDTGIDDIFTENVIYTESWGPKYNNRKAVKHWFEEWNSMIHYHVIPLTTMLTEKREISSCHINHWDGCMDQPIL